MAETQTVSTGHRMPAPAADPSGAELLPFDPRARERRPHDPLEALLRAGARGALALITAVEGPSYRPVGAMMAFLPDGRRSGSLSSGCIEADLQLHAQKVMAQEAPALLRYGAGSPFFDLKLPCGGGLEILLLPCPPASLLGQVARLRAARRGFSLAIGLRDGAVAIGPDRPTGKDGHGLFHVRLGPEPRFLIFGKGPEVAVFAGLVQAALLPGLVLSHDDETLAQATAIGMPVRPIDTRGLPGDVEVDRDTAAVLFYHEHHYETAILRRLLAGSAFYIGAQGSRRARDARLEALRAAGMGEPALGRLRGPIGVVPSARDARLLAISVLAEILALHAQRPA